MNKKIKRETLKKDTGSAPFNTTQGEEYIIFNYELEKLICPICKKEWLSLSINNNIVFGGEWAIFSENGLIECCSDCIDKKHFIEVRIKDNLKRLL